MNAAQLDNYLKAEDAFNAALADGKSEDDAKQAAIEAVAANNRRRTEERMKALGAGFML